jgi:two-component system, NarL family, response regulator NreC
MAAPVRVVLAEDHPMMRRSLRLLLESEVDVEVVAEAIDLRTAEREVRRHRPAVLVLDLRLRDGSSIEAIRLMREQAPRVQIVVLTMDDSPGYAEEALRAGAVGFVLKDTADAELGDAIRNAAAGDYYTSPRMRSAGAA